MKPLLGLANRFDLLRLPVRVGEGCHDVPDHPDRPPVKERRMTVNPQLLENLWFVRVGLLGVTIHGTRSSDHHLLPFSPVPVNSRDALSPLAESAFARRGPSSRSP